MEHKSKTGFNQNHFAIIYMMIALAGVYAATYFDFSTLNIASSSINGVALWLGSMLGLVVTMNGLNCDVWEEVIKHKNTGLGIMVGLFGVAVAIVIHG